MKNTVPLYQVDAFTEHPFAGNPAAVCLLPEPREESWMQAVAGEMNLSETAFVVPEEGAFQLRWFTPTSEVDLCGHATLATAHTLWETGTLGAGQTASFRTKSGTLSARRENDRIVLDFPADPDEPAEAPKGLADALGTTPAYVGRARFGLLAELESERSVRGLKPDFDRLGKTFPDGIVVTSAAVDEGFDFVSRCFAPNYGINEDPVTGSAHCLLACYWARKTGRTEFRAYQASARGGVIEVRLRGDRVELLGSAVTVLRGQLLV